MLVLTASAATPTFSLARRQLPSQLEEVPEECQKHCKEGVKIHEVPPFFVFLYLYYPADPTFLTHHQKCGEHSEDSEAYFICACKVETIIALHKCFKCISSDEAQETVNGMNYALFHFSCGDRS
jgi:hypothetical protein